jgi:CBS domain-containing protein
MATVNDLIRNRVDFYAVEANRSVLDAVRLMVEKNIGAVPVLRGGELIGIFSERDLMRRVVSRNLDPLVTAVHEVMTPEPATVSPEEDLHRCLSLMLESGFRHLPICEGKQFKALISLRDILQQQILEKDGEVRMMRSYIAQS